MIKTKDLGSMVFLFLGVGAILTTVASFVFGLAWLMPILGTLVIYPLYIRQVQLRQYHQSLKWVLIWAVLQSLAVIIATIIAPEKASKVVLNGQRYTEEMFHWIRTGEGAEGTFHLFLPLHLREYALFSLLSLITLGAASLLLGTYLLNYMNYYVGQLILASTNPLLASIIGWPIWSMLRVMGYICTGLALTALGLNMISSLRKKEHLSNFPIRYLLAGIGFLIGDLLVKAIIAPTWRKMLFYALTGS